MCNRGAANINRPCIFVFCMLNAGCYDASSISQVQHGAIDSSS